MKKYILLFFLALYFSSPILAQSELSNIGYVNSDYILELMPDKEKARTEILKLNNGYKEELRVMQNEYNKKYVDFITYQTSMSENIRLRRMQELYELERKISEFVKISQDDVLSREQILVEPLRMKIKTAISEVGVDNGFQIIYDLSNPAILFVTPDAVDITKLVLTKMKIQK